MSRPISLLNSQIAKISYFVISTIHLFIYFFCFRCFELPRDFPCILQYGQRTNESSTQWHMIVLNTHHTKIYRTTMIKLDEHLIKVSTDKSGTKTKCKMIHGLMSKQFSKTAQFNIENWISSIWELAISHGCICMYMFPLHCMPYCNPALTPSPKHTIEHSKQ